MTTRISLRGICILTFILCVIFAFWRLELLWCGGKCSLLQVCSECIHDAASVVATGGLVFFFRREAMFALGPIIQWMFEIEGKVESVWGVQLLPDALVMLTAGLLFFASAVCTVSLVAVIVYRSYWRDYRAVTMLWLPAVISGLVPISAFISAFIVALR